MADIPSGFKLTLDNKIGLDHKIRLDLDQIFLNHPGLKELVLCEEGFQEALSGKGFEQYTIQRGDTLSRIASKHGTTWQYLQRINCIPDADQIEKGATLLLPEKPLESETIQLIREELEEIAVDQ